MSKFAQNCGFWPTEADTMSTFRQNLACKCRPWVCCRTPNLALVENTGRKPRQKSPSGHHRTTLSGYIFAIKAWKKLIKQQYLLYTFPQYGTFRPTRGPVVCGTPPNFNGFRAAKTRLGSVTVRHSGSGRQPNCGAEQMAPPIFGRATITLGIGPHSSLSLF